MFWGRFRPCFRFCGNCTAIGAKPHFLSYTLRLITLENDPVQHGKRTVYESPAEFSNIFMMILWGFMTQTILDVLYYVL